MEEKLLMLHEIVPATKNWKAKVRVLRKTEPRTGNVSPIKYQKLILKDEMGNSVDAIIFGEFINNFRDVLKEGGVYVIKNAWLKDPKQYKNPLVSCPWQWILNGKTSVVSQEDDTMILKGLEELPVIPSSEFHKFINTKTCISTACVVIARLEPHSLPIKWGQGQGQKMVHEYAAVDKELQPFVITFWENTVPEEIYDMLDSVTRRPAVLLLNFLVTPYFGLSLSSNVQSIVLDRHESDVLLEMGKWKTENKLAIDYLVEGGGLFEKKVFRSPKQAEQTTPVAQLLQTHEDRKIFIIHVQGRLDHDYQSFIYMGCQTCTTSTSADFNTEFTCSRCDNSIQIAKPRIKFRLTVFDSTGELEVTFFGTDAEKVLDMKTPEFYANYTKDSSTPVATLTSRLREIVMTLSVRSHMYKEKVYFTVTAVEPAACNGETRSIDMPELGSNSASPLTEQTQSACTSSKSVKKKLTFESLHADEARDGAPPNVNSYSDSANVPIVGYKRRLQSKGKVLKNNPTVTPERVSDEIIQLQDDVESLGTDKQDTDDGQPIAVLFKRTKHHGKKAKDSRKHLIISDSEDDCNTLDGKTASMSKSGLISAPKKMEQPVKTSKSGRIIKAKKLD